MIARLAFKVNFILSLIYLFFIYKLLQYYKMFRFSLIHCFFSGKILLGEKLFQFIPKYQGGHFTQAFSC